MTGIDRSKVNLAFRIVRDDIKTTVPPCENTIDTSTHYEVVAKNGDQNHLLVYVIAHDHVITIGFSPDLSSEVLHERIPNSLLRKMNKHHRLEIHDLQGEGLRQDIQDALANLMNYYTQMGWIAV